MRMMISIMRMEYDDDRVSDADPDECDGHNEFPNGDEIYLEAESGITLGAVAVVLASSKILLSSKSSYLLLFTIMIFMIFLIMSATCLQCPPESQA